MLKISRAEAIQQWNRHRKTIFYPKTDFDFDLSATLQRKSAFELSESDHAFLRSELGPNCQVARLPNAGTLHALFRISAQGKNYYLKISLEEPDFSLDIDIWAHLKIQEFGLAKCFQGTNRHFLEEAKGQPLKNLEDVETQAIQPPLLFELGKAVATVHKNKCAGAGFLNPESLDFRLEYFPPSGLHERWLDYIHLRLAEHVDICVQIGAVSEAEKAIIFDIFTTFDLNAAPIRLLHGDLGHHNIFAEKGKITAIIDWEDALAGDPVFDIAYWGTFVRDEMRAEFLEGYQTIAPLPVDFEQRYWLYYLRVALSKTVHRHRFGAKDRPGRPPASQRIQKALSKLTKL